MIYTLLATNPAIDMNVNSSLYARQPAQPTLFTHQTAGLRTFPFTLAHYGVESTISRFSGWATTLLKRLPRFASVKPVWIDGITRVNMPLRHTPEGELKFPMRVLPLFAQAGRDALERCALLAPRPGRTGGF